MNLNFKKHLLQAKVFFLEISDLESNTYDDDDFKSGNHDDHLSSLDDLIAYEGFDIYEDLVLILAK